MNRGDFNVGDWPFGAIELLRPYDDWQSLAPVAVIRACTRTASATAACRQCRRCLLLVASAWQQLSRPEPPQLRVTHRLQAEDGAAPGLQRSLTHAAHKGAVKCAAAVGQA